MAVVANPVDSILVASYQTGLNESGNPIIRNRSFASVRVEALDQDVYDVAQALYGLQVYPLTNVRRDNRVNLIFE